MVCPSRERIQCGYKNCSYIGQRRLLKSHTKSKHASNHIVEKSNMEKFLLSSHTIETADLGIISRQNVEDDGDNMLVDEVEDNICIEENLPRTRDVGTMTSSQTVDNYCELSDLANMLSLLARDLSNIDREKIKELSAVVKSISNVRLTNPSQKQTSAMPCIDHDFNVNKFYGIRTIAGLTAASGGTLTCNIERNLVYCNICVSEETAQPGINCYSYDMNQGTEFQRDEKLPLAYKNLKSNIVCHFESRIHLSNTEKLKEETKEINSRNQISRRVLRTGYHVLKLSHAQEEFCRLLFLQHVNGIKLGNIGHSTAQLNQLRDAFSEVTLDGIQKFCESVSCVSVAADKVTINHRTVDLISLQAIVPEQNAGDLIQCIVIGAPEVAASDGKSLAENWKSILSRIGINNISKLAAIGTDGQYHHLSVPKIFSNMLNTEEEDICVPAVWDGGHLLELACNSAIKQCNWVSALTNIVSTISKHFRNPKALLDAEKAAANKGNTFRQPILWCETRWGTYARDVLEVFLKNYSTYKAQVDCDLKTGKLHLVEEVDSFKKNGPNIRLMAAALMDIFTAVSFCSLSLQDLQKLPWEKLSSFPKLWRDLKNKKLSLENLEEGRSCNVEELILQEDFKEVWPTLYEYPNLNNEQIKELVSLLDTMITQLQKRWNGENAKGNKIGTANQILNQSSNDLQMIGDLVGIRNSRCETRTKFMVNALERLFKYRLVPNIEINESCFRRVYDELHKHQPGVILNNQELFKFLWQKSYNDIYIKSYIDLVTRLDGFNSLNWGGLAGAIVALISLLSNKDKSHIIRYVRGEKIYLRVPIYSTTFGVEHQTQF